MRNILKLYLFAAGTVAFGYVHSQDTTEPVEETRIEHVVTVEPLGCFYDYMITDIDKTFATLVYGVIDEKPQVYFVVPVIGDENTKGYRPEPLRLCTRSNC